MDPSEINHSLPYSELFDLLLDIPDASIAYPERQISQGAPNEFLGLSHGELSDAIDFDSMSDNLPMSDFQDNEGVGNLSGLLQANQTFNAEFNNLMDSEHSIYQTSEDQDHQNHESLTVIDNPSTSTHLTPRGTSDDTPSSYAVIPGIESNPKCAWPTNDSTLGLQQDPVQLLQLSDANQVQRQTAPISFDTMQLSPPQEGSFAELHDPSHSYPSVLNTFRSPLVPSQPTSSKSLSTSISLMPNAFMVPYQQQTLQPKPISSYPPRLASSILSTGQISLGSTTSPEHKTVVQKPMNLPGKRKRKRITDFTTVTAYEPQLKKRQKSTTNEKMTRNLHSFSIAQNPSKDKVSQKKNMRPCLRCKRNRKGCTGGYPCEGCQPYILQALKRRSDQNIYWTHCIKSDVWEFNYFAHSMRRLLSSPGVSKPKLYVYFLSFTLKGVEPKYSSISELIPSDYLRYDKGWAVCITALQLLGRYIVGQSPTAQRLWSNGSIASKIENLESKRLPSGSAWKSPPPPSIISRLHSESEFSGLVWVAICLHGKVLSEYLGLPYSAFRSPLVCLNHFFLRILSFCLTCYQRAGTRSEKTCFGIHSMANLYSFITLARRGFDSISLTLEERGSYPGWDPGLSEHVIGFCQYHLEMFKKDSATICSEKRGGDYFSHGAQYQDACEEIAQMDLSKWKEEGVCQGVLKELFGDWVGGDDEEDE